MLCLLILKTLFNSIQPRYCQGLYSPHGHTLLGVGDTSKPIPTQPHTAPFIPSPLMVHSLPQAGFSRETTSPLKSPSTTFSVLEQAPCSPGTVLHLRISSCHTLAKSPALNKSMAPLHAWLHLSACEHGEHNPGLCAPPAHSWMQRTVCVELSLLAPVPQSKRSCAAAHGGEENAPQISAVRPQP